MAKSFDLKQRTIPAMPVVDLDANKREAALDFLGLETQFFRDLNPGFAKEPEDCGKLISVVRVRASGTTYRVLELPRMNYTAAVRLTALPLDLQRRLMRWSKGEKKYRLAYSRDALEKMAALSPAELAAKLDTNGS